MERESKRLLVPGYRETFTASGTVRQIEIDERLIWYAGFLRLHLKLGDRILRELNRHLFL